MSKVCISTSNGGFSLSPENEKRALEAGCIGFDFGEQFPADAVKLGHSTTGWTGIYRGNTRLARFRDFGRALKYAQRIAPQAA